MPETFTEVAHPGDITYQMRRQKQIDELLTLDSRQLDRKLRYQLSQPANEAIRDDGMVSKQVVREISNAQFVPGKVKALLDTTSGTTGNLLIRQDLEPTLYALFVRQFPVFERLAKGPSNGLVHAATQITSPEDAYSLGGTLISELGTVSPVRSDYARATFPIAVFATARGLSIKELAAVQAGGAGYDPQKTELANGMTRLAMDVQNQILMGNASNAGGTASQEAGLYNANGFDGMRGVIGSQGVFAGNNAVQVDIGNAGYGESLQNAASSVANAGGAPSIAFMSINAKQGIDQENQNDRRYNDEKQQIIPGVNVQSILWANGKLDLVPFAGNTLGSYSYNGGTVEDIYVLDESTVTVRWLYSESFTVLQLPVGYDNTLSERLLVFGMFGLELAAPAFSAKVRRTL